MLYIEGLAQISNRYPFYMDDVPVLENMPESLNILDSNQESEINGKGEECPHHSKVS